MQIVIDIPEEYYNAIKEISDENSTADMLLIKYGTPLPKGHGKLKDETEIFNILNKKYLNFSSRRDLNLFADIVEKEAKTIIEADKEGENEWKKNIHSGKRNKRS